MAAEGAVSEARDLDEGEEAARTEMAGRAKKTKKTTKRKKRARSPAFGGAKTCAKAKKRKARKKKAQKRKKRARGPAKDQAKKPKACEDARADRPSLEVFEALTAAEPEPVSSEPAAEAETEAEERSEAELPADARVLSPPKGAAAPAAELDSRGPEGPPRQESSPGEDPAEEHSPREDAPEEIGPEEIGREEIAPEELTPEEALAMLAENGINRRFTPMDADNTTSKKGCCRIGVHLRPSAVASAVAGPAGRARRPRPPGSVIMPSCRAIAFESACVVSEMRVAATTVARLYGMVTREGLDLELGRVCQTVDELVDEWDDTPLGQSIILLVNLMGASGFLDEIVADCPEAGEAYWIVYETLRGEVTSARNEFLARQRAMRRAKAVGFGPRNVVAAARSAAEAVRWRVEWGYGSAGAAKAG